MAAVKEPRRLDSTRPPTLSAAHRTGYGLGDGQQPLHAAATPPFHLPANSTVVAVWLLLSLAGWCLWTRHERWRCGRAVLTALLAVISSLRALAFQESM